MKNKSHIYLFIKSTGYVFLSQSISLFLSIMTSLILPRFLGIKDFSFWQLFLFYASYAGIFNLGLIDGIYLKIGGKEYGELNFAQIAGQFKILCGFMALCTLIIISGQYFIPVLEAERRYVLICTAIYIFLANASWYIEYIFQATYKIRNFAVSTIIDKTSFLVLMTVGICLFPNRLIYFLSIYLLGRFLSLLYLLNSSKQMLRTKTVFSKKILHESFELISIGINLTISSISGMLILGINRKVIDLRWGIESFGKFSLAISLSNFFLVFIQQISKVLFPVLRRMDGSKKYYYYEMLSIFLNIILPISFVLYIPLKYLLSLWLPQYQESFQYLAFLLPICLFDGKMQLLCNTYFKVLREEKFLLKINLWSMILSAIGAVVGGWLINNVLFIMFSMVVVIAVRSIFSECYLAHILDKNIHEVQQDLLTEVIIVLLFILIAWNMTGIGAFFLICLLYFAYLMFHRNKIKLFLFRLKKQFMEEI